MIVRTDEGYRCMPLLEVNARNTMGRIAWSMRRFIARGVPARWTLFRRADLARWGFASDDAFLSWVAAHPLERRADGAWVGGVLLTTEWDGKRELGSMSGVGAVAPPL